MQLYHEPAPLRKGRQIDFFKINFYRAGNVGCGKLIGGEGLLLGRCVIAGATPREARVTPAAHLPCLSSKMCPLLIDWRGLEGDFSRPMLQKELVFLSLKKSLASSMKAARASPSS